MAPSFHMGYLVTQTRLKTDLPVNFLFECIVKTGFFIIDKPIGYRSRCGWGHLKPSGLLCRERLLLIRR